MRSPLAIARERLSARIFLSFGFLFLVVVLFFSGVYLYDRWQLAREAFMREGTSLARVLAFNARVGIVTHNTGFIKGALDGVTSYEGVVSAGVYSPEGKPILEERGALGSGSPTFPLPPDVNGALKMSPGPIRFETAKTVEFWAPIILEAGSFSEEELYFGASSQDIRERTIGFGRVIFDKGSVTNAFRFLVANSILIALAAIVLWGILAYVIGRKITRPLDRLTDGVRALRDGDFRKVDVVSSDEVGRLALAFNGMVAALEQREAERSRAQEAISVLNNELEQRVIGRTAELEKATREMESFNYSVSHDLRAPLVRLKGFCLALEEDFSDKLDSAGRFYLERIMSTCDQMGRVVAAIMSLTQVSRGELCREKVNLSPMVERIIAELRESEPQRRVTVIIEPGVQVDADPRLVSVVLDNLVGNAWKFTGGKPEGLIEFGAVASVEGAFFILDNGAGFDMAYAERLFRPFERLHGHDEFPGTGVGLALVKRIVDRHGGYVRIDSGEGKGTMVVCSFRPLGMD